MLHTVTWSTHSEMVESDSYMTFDADVPGKDRYEAIRNYTPSGPCEVIVAVNIQREYGGRTIEIDTIEKVGKTRRPDY